MDEDMQEEMYAECCQNVGEALAAALPPLDAPHGKDQILGRGVLSVSQLDLTHLYKVREQHQTRLAAQAVRTRSQEASDREPGSEEQSLRRQIIQEYYKSQREQEERGVGTGKEREARWGSSSAVTGQASGNSANAAATAASAAVKVSVICQVRVMRSGTDIDVF